MFAKTPDDALAGLVKELDKKVAANQGQKVAAVVNFTGEATDDYLDKIKRFGEKHGIEHVALTVTSDGDRFRVNEDAEVTVMHYRGKKVAYNRTVAPGELDKSAIDDIVSGMDKILN